MDRLYRKGYLNREKQAKAFVYSPRHTRNEFERTMAQEVLGALIGHSTETAVLTLLIHYRMRHEPHYTPANISCDSNYFAVSVSVQSVICGS